MFQEQNEKQIDLAKTRLKSRCRKDNENQTLIKENWICSLAEVVIEGSEVDILENKIS